MEKMVIIDHNEIERRKEIVRRVWSYKKVDHIPIGIWLDDFSKYTLREQCEHGELQLEVAVGCMNRCMRLLPDDYIPYVRLWPGYMTIATMFGIPLHWSDDPNQPPGIQEHLITDISQIYELSLPSPLNDGLMPHNIQWLRYAADNLPEDVYIAGIDLGGPLNTAKDLLDTNLLYTAFYDSPDELHVLLGMVTTLQIRCYEEVVKAVGGMNRLTSIDFDPLWAPEGYKGFCSDDVCSTFSPELFREFSIPYNNRIFGRFGGGRIHNCGPHPSVRHYLNHTPFLKGLNCSFRYSLTDCERIKDAFRNRGIVEVNFDFNESFEEIVQGYERFAHSLAPDVIALPLVFLNESWSDEAITDLYRELRGISECLAGGISWQNE